MNIPWQVGKGIAIAALIAAATTLEMHDKPAGGLWTLIVLWIIFGGWT